MEFDLVADNAQRLLGGFYVTISIVSLSGVFSALLCIPLVSILRSEGRGYRAIGEAYLLFFRGSPLLAQLFLIYYGSGQFRSFWEAVGLWWLFRDAFFCSVLAFSLNSAAYTSALVKGAIDSVPVGQREAATALGLGRWKTMRKVILPQAFKSILPAYGNELIILVKASAITTAVTLYDLMGTIRVIYSRTFDLSIYFWAALMYVAIVSSIRLALMLVKALAFRSPG